MTEPNELRPSEVARLLGTSTRTVQRWIAQGALPARRVGGRWRVAFDALDAFRTKAAAPEDRDDVQRDPPDAALSGSIRAVFVANRGEIAARIRRTCDRLGIVTIVPGENGRREVDLLDPDAVVAAARAAAADAVHPGFGFLSENAAFAERVIGAGLRWVGPPPAAIRTMGDKAAARRLAVSLGIPVVPGYDAADQTDAALIGAARAIGTPLIVKPAAGGGGKGMRVVRELGTLPEALAAARRAAHQAFGDDRLVLERYLEGPRHVEVQVLFDAAGRGVHLGERDCSLQRRHQKVLEETPSPAVDPALRARLGSSALALAAAVGYVNAGTCEFLLADDGQAFFIEMNTRLQVEHPVTELATGRDLVADQLRIAAGGSLGIDQATVDRVLGRGIHAIEVRLYAEDPDAGFLPATGRVEALVWPPDVDGSVRVDTGIVVGTEVGPRFDPMLAKIAVAGRDRRVALARLTAALDATSVLGLTTNLPFLRWLVRRPEVIAGEARIDTLERIWPAEAPPASESPEDAWAAAAEVLDADASAPADPWTDGWRINGGRRIRLVTDAGLERSIEVGAAPTGGRRPTARAADGAVHVDVGGRSVAFRIAPPPDVDRAARAAIHLDGTAMEVTSPMPGNVLSVHVGVGQRVEAGDALATIEAMKMEHVVVAPTAGVVRELAVARGDQVRRGQLIADLG